MRYQFERFEIDTEAFSLSAGGAPVHIEPLVFDLLRHLVENAGQLVSREDMIERVWKGRFVSDATVSSCIKSARKALGDDGKTQSIIRTVRGRGLRFVAAVTPVPGGPEPMGQTRVVQEAAPAAAPCERKVHAPPKIAILPLFPLSGDAELAVIGDAIAQEVILEVSRLHWLFVIARGSSFKFRGQVVDLQVAAGLLGANYFLTGTIVQQDQTCVVAVELCRMPDANVVWAERFETPVAEIMHMRATLAGEIVRALEPRIQLSEAMQAARIPTERLDAWSAYHRGLWHMFRFNERDNGLAEQLFTHAVTMDPGFARAHAGLSFTQFQNAFLGLSHDSDEAKRLMRKHADRSMELDPLDPFVNLTMGRVEWLYGNLEAGLPWMERSIALSPNYAFAIYNSALMGTILGEGENSEKRVLKAIALSPIDPLGYAMLATRAMSHLVRGNYAEAAELADRAVQLPHAHVQIHAVAAVFNELAGNHEKAQAYIERVRQMSAGYDRWAFLKSFPFRDQPIRLQVEQSLIRLGL